jgi:putative ABC transport system permease protein
VKTLLWRSSFRFYKRHPWQMVLAMLGITLGVAVVVAVDLANESARRAFSHSVQLVTGQATHQIIGGPAGLEEGVYVTLRRQGLARDSAPLISAYAQLEDQILHLLGVDPFAEGRFRRLLDHASAEEGEGAIRRLLLEPGAVVMGRATALKLGLRLGDVLTLQVSGLPRVALLVGFLDPPTGQAAVVEDLLLMDISTAQELTGMAGRISRIDLRLDDGEVAAVNTMLPADARLVTAGLHGRALGQMTDAFQLNLTAMSLLALLVGMFLIYNTLSFSVLQRRELIGNLRVLGVTRAAIAKLVLGEGLLIGLVGTLLGVLLGILLAQELLKLVVRTINDLYFVLEVTQLYMTPLSVFKALTLGVGGSLIAVMVPAREASRSPPRMVLSRSRIEEKARHLQRPLALVGLALMSAALLLLLPGRSLVLGFAALFLLMLGFSLLTPLGVVLCGRLASPLLGRLFGLPGRMAARGVIASLSRTGVAVAALSIAISSTVGVGVMVESFRHSVAQWLGTTLQGDIYIAPPVAPGSGSDRYLDPAVITAIEGLPGIAEISRGRPVDIQSSHGITQLFAIQMASKSYAGMALLAGEPDRVWRQFDQEQAVLVSEPYAYRHRLQVGDALPLATDRGEQRFRVAGIYRDYGSDQGVVTLRISLYRQYWDDDSVFSVGLYLEPGTEVEPLMEKLRAMTAPTQSLRIRSNRVLRESSLEIFDRTFAITHVLRLLAIGIAFVGILSALMALQLEKARELAVLRATGFTPSQVWRLVTIQTGFMGLISGLLAMPLGLMLALVLIHVINRRAFGWSMELMLPGGVLFEALLLALFAALLAGLYPAWRMARIAPARVLREE